MSEFNGVVYAAPAPPGVTPDWNRPYQATGLVIVIAVTLPLAVIATSIRVFTRTYIVRVFAADDYFMLGALACSIVLCALICDMLKYGLGKNLWSVPLNILYPYFMKDNFIASIFFCAATGLVKTSILLFYRRIFPSRKFHLVIWIIVAYTLGFSIAAMGTATFSCSPIEASWDLAKLATAKCIANRPISYFVQAGLSILADFLTVLAPLPVIWKLQMPMRQKIGVILILTLGGFVCIVSIIRLQTLVVLLRGVDLTTDTVNALLWCVIELNVSIIAGCAPTYRPFVRKYFPAILPSSIRYASNTGGRSLRLQSQPQALQSLDRRGFSASAKGSAGRSTISASPQGGNESAEFIIPQDDNESREMKSGQIKMTVEYGFEDFLEQGKPDTKSPV